MADPTQSGLVVDEPIATGTTFVYSVFFSARDVRDVNERVLEPAFGDSTVRVLTRAAFLQTLLLTKLENPLSNLLYAYQASRTQFEAYQFKPILKLLDAPVPGILIADEVGLGKTIEAAIIFEELKARVPLGRVLVICPAGLRAKWQAELLTRFDEHFQLMRTDDVVTDLRLYREMEGRQPLRGIVALETIRSRRLQDEFEGSAVRYDLVIIDEAHHLRTAGRLSNEIGGRMSELTDNLVLLTATPLQTSQEDLFNLLRFVDESQFTELGDFLLQLEPNAYLNAAIRALRERPPDAQLALRQLDAIAGLEAGSQVTVHPDYQPVRRRLQNGPIAGDELVVLQRSIDRMNVLSSVYTRTRKRDVADIARRQAHVFAVPLTEAELDFYQAVLSHARAQAMAASRTGWIPGFVGMMRERQAASCMAATREYLVELYRDRDTELGVEASETDVAPDDLEEQERTDPALALGRLLEAAGRLGDHDSKFEVFLRALDEAMEAGPDSKVIVFTFFLRTLGYLERELRKRGQSVVTISGKNTPEERAYAIDRFKTDPKLRILLTSEVGAEGLDFQFCDTLFNYDLPWNPMRVEQRIGRIDRYGQESEKVRVYSFFLENTVEQRILERLYTRIGIFEDSIGDLEPILGPLAHELTRDVFTMDLTPEEEEAVAEQFARRVAYQRLDREELEGRQAELLGQDALLLQEIHETVDSGRYVSAAELRAVVERYVTEVGAVAELRYQPGEATALLIVDQKLAGAVEDHVVTNGDYRPTATALVARLHRDKQIGVTFDGETANRSRRLEFLNLRHPLVRAAADHAKRHGRPDTPLTEIRALAVQNDGLPPGRYRFGLFLLETTGARGQTRLLPVVFDEADRRAPAVERRLLRLIQDDGTDGERVWTADERDDLVRRARVAASGDAERVEAEAQERNDGWLAVREATLRRTYETRIEKRQRQLFEAADERIARMRTAEIRNLQGALESRLHELDAQRRVSVSYRLVGAGAVEIQSGHAGDGIGATTSEEAPWMPQPGEGPFEPPPVWAPGP